MCKNRTNKNDRVELRVRIKRDGQNMTVQVWEKGDGVSLHAIKQTAVI